MVDRKVLPAYGRELLAAQRAGRNVDWLLIALDWGLGRAMPRLVVTDDIDVAELSLGMVKGLPCMVAHLGKTPRAVLIAEIALRYGAMSCVVFDAQAGKTTHTTNELFGMFGAAGWAK